LFKQHIEALWLANLWLPSIYFIRISEKLQSSFNKKKNQMENQRVVIKKNPFKNIKRIHDEKRATT
jgi:hypothetical protein